MNVNGSTNSLININSSKSKAETSLEKMAKGVNDKINDAALRSVAGILNSQASVLTQGVSNANDNVSILQIADGALASISDDTQRLNELSVKMNNGALNQEQKGALNSEFNALNENINRTLSTTSYNGQSLFGKSFEFSLGDSTITSNISKPSGSLDINSQESITNFLSSVNSSRSDIGSSSNAIQSSINTLLENITNNREAASNMIDTDIANEVVNFDKSELQLNAAIISQSHQTETLQNKIQMLLG